MYSYLSPQELEQARKIWCLLCSFERGCILCFGYVQSIFFVDFISYSHKLPAMVFVVLNAVPGDVIVNELMNHYFPEILLRKIIAVCELQCLPLDGMLALFVLVVYESG